MTNYTTVDVAVRGGELRVGVWDSGDVAAGAPPERAVLALHGVTASHRSWSLVAASLTEQDGVRVIAPDLRGRGRSTDLPGPWGMPQHADDAAAALGALGVTQAVVVGHSMGGFVAMVFAHRHPQLTSALVLVDGGIPLPPPPGVSPEQLLKATLGPAAERLAMTFPTRQAYQDFWRQHPALSAEWSDAIADYVDYDLVGTEPNLYSSCRYEAVAEDSRQLGEDGSLLAAWDGLAHNLSFLRAPLGLFGEPPGLYPPAALKQWQERIPRFRWSEVPGVNHYTISLGPAGAAAVAGEISEAARSVPHPDGHTTSR